MLPGSQKHLRKYLLKDGTFLGDFKLQKVPVTEMVLNMKMINFFGDMILKVRAALSFAHA